MDEKTQQDRNKFWEKRFGKAKAASSPNPKTHWRTRDGLLVPFRTLSTRHLLALAQQLRKRPRMRQATLIRKELLRRGLGRYLKPSYPEL